LLTTSDYFKNKDKTNFPMDRPLEECKGGQWEEEMDLEDPYNDPEIVEQSALNHFNAILQKA